MTTSHRTRLLGAVALVLWPLLYAASGLAWPSGSEGSNDRIVHLAASHPGAWNAAGLLEAVAALSGLLGAAVLVLVVTGRGRVLARISLGLAVCQVIGSVATWVLGAVTVAQAGALPHDRALTAYDATVRSGYLVPFIVQLFLGVLGSVLLLVTAVRARLAPWWVLVLGLAGLVGTSVVTADVVRVLPSLVLAGTLALVARGVLRGPAEEPVPAARLAEGMNPAPVR